MAVLSLGTSATDALFLEYIFPGIEIQLKENTKLYDRFENVDKITEGKYAIFKVASKAPTSFRPSSSSTYPTAKQGTYAEFKLYMKRIYAQLQFDGLAIACGKGKGAVKDIVKSEVELNITYGANYLNRIFWGDGSGRLAQLNAASSNSTRVDIDHPFFGKDSNEYTPAHRYLEEGMSVDIYNTSKELVAEDIEISTITDDGDGTSYLTMAEAVTAANDSWILDHDTYAASEAAGTGVPQGLYGIVATTDPYVGLTQVDFQNVDRGTYTWAQAQAWNHSSAAITDLAILKAIQKVEEYGRVNVIISNGAIWRAYYEQKSSDVTRPDATTFWGGTAGIDFYGGRAGKIPWIWDDDCPDNRIYVLDSNYLQVYAPFKNGLTWARGENGILTRVQGKDEETCALVWYYNFGTTKPKALGVIYGVKHASS